MIADNTEAAYRINYGKRLPVFQGNILFIIFPSPLRVNHSVLKDRIAARSLSENTEIQTCFFELPPPQSPPTSECLVEMENIRGDKMRMHFSGEVNFDLLTLGQDFWRR